MTFDSSSPAAGLLDAGALNQRDALLREALHHPGLAPLVAVSSPPNAQRPNRALRAARYRYMDPREQAATLALQQASNGVLRWEYRSGRAHGMNPPAGAYRAVGSVASARQHIAHAPSGYRVLDVRQVPNIGPNQVTEALISLDQRLNASQGLRRLHADGTWRTVVGPLRDDAKRVLLFVHGTFSKSEMFLEELSACNQGRAFLDSLRPIGGKPCAAGYDEVIAFDHPTLSVSPYLNALQLEMDLTHASLPRNALVDVISHSRGGVVCAWWVLHTRFRVRRLIAVGAPLRGTSLASPHNIRYLLDYLANASLLIGGVGQAAASVPSFASAFLAASSGLFEIFGRLLSGLARVPAVDGAVALVPGLHSQARTTNNLELRGLLRAHNQGSNVKVFTVTSDFEPSTDHPWWNVWAHFKSLPILAANSAADRLFPGANDLVVDCETMAWFASTAGQLSFRSSDGVHHCSYFRQDRTVAAFSQWLA